MLFGAQGSLSPGSISYLRVLGFDHGGYHDLLFVLDDSLTSYRFTTRTEQLTYSKTFSKFYRRHYELISKYNVGLKTLLSEGLSEPEFYGDLVYKFKKLIGINDFSFQFRKIITRYRRIGYNLNVMRQSACLVFNPIMVDNYAAFFNCTPVDRASDSMMAPTYSYSF